MNDHTVKPTPADARNCPQCGTPLPTGALAGLCPACLLAQGAAADTVTEGKQPPFNPPPVAELAPLFPQLEILELIGKGGMGAVYKARQKQLDRIVALKILPPGIGDDPAFAERFAREAKALAKLNHPGIVTLYEFGVAAGILPAVEPGFQPGGKSIASTTRVENSGVAASSSANPGGKMPPSTAAKMAAATPLYFFLMEFVDGVNLRQLLHAGRISPREALAIVPQICDALQFAHDQGIVHRDIKPENILLDRRSRVKVADFGLAKIVGAERGSVSRSGAESGNATEPPRSLATSLSAAGHRPALRDLTDTGKVMGTPNYMAPEQVSHPADVDHRADIYALGVVFYQMLTGELPGKRLAPPSSKVRIDVRLDEVVLRALEKNPELRYQQVSEVKTCVETIVGSTTDPAGEPKTLPNRRRNFWKPFNSPLVGQQNGEREIIWSAVYSELAVIALILLIAYIFVGAEIIFNFIIWIGCLDIVVSLLRGWFFEPLEKLPDLNLSVAFGSTGGPPAEPGAAPGATANKSEFVRLFEAFSGSAFTSPLSIKLINISALGFLGCLAFFGFLPLPGMRRCFGFSGFTGFFGLIGVAFMVEMAKRRKAKTVSGSPSPGATRDGWWRRHLLPDDTAARLAQLACFGVALVVLVMGILKLATLELRPHELLFGVVLVLILSVVMVVLGLLAGSVRGPSSPGAARFAAPTSNGSKAVPIAAKVGFAWIVLFFSVLGWFGIWTFLGNDLKSTPSAIPILPFGFVAAVVSTVCGWLAVHKIRHSRGQLGGLGLALFDGLLFPLLALDGLIGVVALLLTKFHAHMERLHGSLFYDIPQLAAWLVLPTGLMVLVDYLIIRRIWRAVNQPLHGAIGSAGGPPDSMANQSAINEAEWRNPNNWSLGFYFSKRDSRTLWVPRRMRGFGWTINLGRWQGAACLLGIVILVPLIPIGVMLNRPQSTDKPSLRVTGRVTDALTAKPIPHARADDNRYGAGPGKSPQQAWTDSNGNYELHTWPEEHTLAASAPGYQTKLATLTTSLWGRERTARMDFQLQPTNTSAALTFGSVVERELTNSALLDFDSGRIATEWPESVTTNGIVKNVLTAFDWMDREGLDFAYLESDGTFGVGMKVKNLTPDDWENITAAQLQNALATLNGGETRTGLNYESNRPFVYGFKTREGGIGLFQITGFTDPRGVKLRYKLVQAQSAASLSEPPQLRFLAWQDEWKTNQPGAARHPDGSPVTDATELKWLKAVWPGRMDVSSRKLNPEPRFLHLWFSHPGFRQWGFYEVSLFDDAGKPVKLGADGSTSSGSQDASDANGNLGWSYWALSPGAGTNIPSRLTVRLRYTMGALEHTQEVLLPFSGMSLEGNSQLNGVGQNVAGKAFVAIAEDVAKLKTRQFDVMAVTKDGRELPHQGWGRAGPVDEGIRVENFDFEIPLAEVAKFIIGTRPIRTNNWQDVVLPIN